MSAKVRIRITKRILRFFEYKTIIVFILKRSMQWLWSAIDCVGGVWSNVDTPHRSTSEHKHHHIYIDDSISVTMCVALPQYMYKRGAPNATELAVPLAGCLALHRRFRYNTTALTRVWLRDTHYCLGGRRAMWPMRCDTICIVTTVSNVWRRPASIYTPRNNPLMFF